MRIGSPTRSVTRVNLTRAPVLAAMTQADASNLKIVNIMRHLVITSSVLLLENVLNGEYGQRLARQNQSHCLNLELATSANRYAHSPFKRFSVAG